MTALRGTFVYLSMFACCKFSLEGALVIVVFAALVGVSSRTSHYRHAAIVTLAFLGCMSCLLMVLACALHGAYWPLFAIIPIVLSPLPTRLANKASDSFSSGNSSVAYELAIFFTTGLVLSGLALPFVFAHAGKIVWDAVGLAVGGTVLGFCTVLIYRLSSPDDGDGFELMAF